MHKYPRNVKTLTIADTEHTTPAIEVSKYRAGIVIVDDALDACDLELLVSASVGGEYVQVDFIDDAAASNAYVLPDAAFYGKWLKFHSLEAGTTNDLAQDGDVVLTLVLIEDVAALNEKLHRNLKSATIAASGTVSTAVDVRREIHGALALPAEWETQDIAFHVSDSYGGTFVPLLEFDGTAYGLSSPAASVLYEIPSDVFKAPFFKIVSAVAQTEECVISVMAVE